MRNKRLFIIFGILLSLTLLIAIGSAVFSVKKVTAYCYNADDEELNAVIEKEKDKLKGRSIFSLNEEKIIIDIEERVGGIKVINIERLFPDRVSINFIKLYEYFETNVEGVYFTFGVDGKITDESNSSKGNNVISVDFGLQSKPKIGDSLDSATDFDTLLQMTAMLEALDYRNTDSTMIIESIDFSDEEYVFVKMRSGVLIQLYHHDNAGDKLRKALSLYMAKPDCRREGTIKVTNNDEVTYSPSGNNYEET